MLNIVTIEEPDVRSRFLHHANIFDIFRQLLALLEETLPQTDPVDISARFRLRQFKCIVGDRGYLQLVQVLLLLLCRAL